MPGQLAWWRQYLGTLSVERKREIAATMGVDQSTMARWITGQTSPRNFEHIRILASLNPEMDIEIRRDFPEAFEAPDDTRLQVPAEYAISITNMLAETASFVQQYTIHTHVYEYMVSQLDPNKQGLMLLFVQCVDPGDPNLPITTLQVHPGHGSNMWRVNQIQRAFLIGSGTLSGTAVSTGKPAFYPQDTSFHKEAPLLHSQRIQSVGAFPLTRGGNAIAGALLVASVYVDFFSPSRRELIRTYANLFSLGLRDAQFFNYERINLQAIPSPQHQSLLLQDFYTIMKDLAEQYPEYKEKPADELEKFAVEKLHEHFVLQRKEKGRNGRA